MKSKYFLSMIIIGLLILVFSSCSKSRSGGGEEITYPYQWTKISTDQTDPATITSPHSPTTTVTGLVQGTWYYQLATTDTGTGHTIYDTVVVHADYDVPPANSKLIEELPIAQVAPVANIRDDTTKYWAYDMNHSQYYDGYNYLLLERGNELGMHVDSERAKFYTTLEDGVEWNGDDYDRSELSWGTGFGIDSSKTYCLEWKGYFPQSSVNIAAGDDLTAIFQLHGNDGYSPPFQIDVLNDQLWWIECVAPSQARTVESEIANYSDFYNHTHTIRITIKEGLAGTGAYIKVAIDGVQKYIRNTGDVGRTWQQDYPKFGTLYDWANAVVNPNNLTSHRKFSLVTESFKVYQIGGTPAILNLAPIGGKTVYLTQSNSAALP